MRAEKRRSPDLRGPDRLGRGGGAGGSTPLAGMPAADPVSAAGFAAMFRSPPPHFFISP
jgi:hypothetical protein